MPASDGAFGNASCASTVPVVVTTASTTSGDTSSEQPAGAGGSTDASASDVVLKPFTTAAIATFGSPVPRVRYVDPVHGSDRAASVLDPPELAHAAPAGTAVAGHGLT